MHTPLNQTGTLKRHKITKKLNRKWSIEWKLQLTIRHYPVERIEYRRRQKSIEYFIIVQDFRFFLFFSTKRAKKILLNQTLYHWCLLHCNGIRVTLVRNRFTFWLLLHFSFNRNRYIYVHCAVCSHIPSSSGSKSDSSFPFFSFFACSFIHCHSTRFFGICFASQWRWFSFGVRTT